MGESSFEEVLELLLYHGLLEVSSSREVTTSLSGSAALGTSLIADWGLQVPLHIPLQAGILLEVPLHQRSLPASQCC